MKAAIRRDYCKPKDIKIESVPIPTVGNSEILIRVMATTVNRTDCANLMAKPFFMRFMLGLFRPKKIILGTDFAGEVVAIGQDVSTYVLGDKVLGFLDAGASSQAEFTVASVEDICLMPPNCDFKTAAASLEGATYAHAFVHRVSIRPRHRIMINGASGGIGSALLQLLHAHHVHISVTCDTKNMELMKSLGADDVYDYTKIDFTSITNKFDFIFDTVGKSTFRKCKPLLNPGGTYVSSELGPWCQNLFLPVLTYWSTKKVVFPIPFDRKVTLPYIVELLARREFVPVIDLEFDLEDISRAYEYVHSGQKTGNVVISMLQSNGHSGP